MKRNFVMFGALLLLFPVCIVWQCCVPVKAVWRRFCSSRPVQRELYDRPSPVALAAAGEITSVGNNVTAPELARHCR